MLILVAEFGDLTQIMTANLAARYDDPLSVGLGAVLALWAVAGLGIVGGKALMKRVPLELITKVAAMLMLALGLEFLPGGGGLSHWRPARRGVAAGPDACPSGCRRRVRRSPWSEVVAPAPSVLYRRETKWLPSALLCTGGRGRLVPGGPGAYQGTPPAPSPMLWSLPMTATTVGTARASCSTWTAPSSTRTPWSSAAGAAGPSGTVWTGTRS